MTTARFSALHGPTAKALALVRRMHRAYTDHRVSSTRVAPRPMELWGESACW